jgi:type I restriction enzyme S subunit
MNAERLVAHYERIADAPDAILRLRRFVLDLAVRGKLVPQDPNDEPALELLKRIAKEKLDQADLPKGWRRARVGALLNFQYGKGLKASERADRGPVPVFGSNGIVGFTVEPLTVGPSIIVGRKGSAGALNLCDGPSWTTDVAYFVEPPPFFQIRFLLNALAALDLDKLGKGVKPGLSRSDAYDLVLSVPPLAEQHRIITKVDDLMALCDRLEGARARREAMRDKLTAVSYSRLNVPDPETFRDDARFALDALPALTARPDQIDQLRQAILNLAVRGKLVPQDPNEGRENQTKFRRDTEAEEYDQRAFEERAALFLMPPNWTIEPLSRVSKHIVDCPHTTPKWPAAGVLCIKTNQVRAGTLDLSSPHFVSEETYQIRIERLEPRCDDILYIREGGVRGVGCRIPPNARLCLGQRLMLIRANESVSPAFLELCINSPWITDFAEEKTTGGAAPRVNMSVVRAYPIPIPPLVEQHRIVAKIDELMALCDGLEASLATADETRRRLLEALLAEALSPDENRELEAAE